MVVVQNLLIGGRKLVVELRNLSFGFKQKILKNVNLKIENRGQVIALLGPNGVGKTTLLNILAGLYQIYDGQVINFGKVIFLPDYPYIPEDLTIKKCLDLFESVYDSFNREKAIQILNYLQLDELKLISSYSKGMKEQLHVVFSLAQDVDVYLFDEPLAAVDPLTRDILIDLIIKFKREKSIVIISTHLILDMERLFDEIIFMKKGEIMKYQSIELLQVDYPNKSLEEIYKELNRNVVFN